MIDKFFKEEKSGVFLVKLALLAFLIRACLAAAYYNFFVMNLKMPVFAFDGEAYSIIGWYIALVLKGANMLMLPQSMIPNDYCVVGGFFGTIANFGGHLPPVYQYGITIYSYMIGLFYYIFGYAPVLLRLFNSGLSVLAAFLAYDITKRVFTEKVARIAFVIMLFNPSFVLYSISLQRDTLVNFLILLVVSEILKLVRPEKLSKAVMPVILSLFGLALLSQLRVNSMAVLVVFIAVFLYIKFAYAFKRLAVYCTLGIFLIPPLYNKVFSILYSKIILMLKYHWGLTFLGGYTFQLLPQNYYAGGDTGEGWFSKGIGAGDLIVAIFKGLGAFFTEPSIFSMRRIQHFIALPQMILWYLLILFAIIGVWESIKRSDPARMSLFAVMILFTLSIGLSEANAETLIRHRDMIVPIYIIFAAKGIEMLAGENHKEVK
jgi:hypothetical protein